MNLFHKLYKEYVLKRPFIGLFVCFLTVAFFAFHTPKFRLDASSDTLTLENDQALEYYREIKDRYGSDDYLVVTYTPQNAMLLNDQSLAHLKALRDDLRSMHDIENVVSILDVPLMQSPPVSLKALSEEQQFLLSAKTDRDLARKELTSSPLYKDLLISQDAQTAALFVTFKDNDVNFQKQWEDNVQNIRDVIKPYQATAHIYIGGVPMIVADSIEFIRKDLKIFGAGLAIFLVLLLSLIFRRWQWVVLSMGTCLCVGICVIGFLGLFDWPVTVVSSNFISLLLIFTLSFCVHQIIRYRECVAQMPEANQYGLVCEMVRTISVPCFFMVFTTVVAFGSLVISDIRPIIDFGWMMSVGLIIAFVVSFTFFPAALMLFKPEPMVTKNDITEKITSYFAGFVQRREKAILTSFFALVVLSVIGVSFLHVQNRFIDYYKKDTGIYQGMEVIDKQLGGTIPLDIVIDAPQEFLDFQAEERRLMEEEGWGDVEQSITDGYFLSKTMINDVAGIHGYLDALPETGKVLSFHTAVALLKALKDTPEVDNFYIGVLYRKLPLNIKNLILNPYISGDGNQIRFSVRMVETVEGGDRKKFLAKVKSDLMDQFNLKGEQIHMTGMLVLYNNVLQTLFSSQIATVWVVFVMMFLVFIVLFRRLKVAAVALIPNMTVTLLVLGLMGWMDIPLDIMTITIAAIAFGTADDNTIHYVHRMMKEYKQHGEYRKAIAVAHGTIGRAVYYTAITVILGFSILGLSNFVPTMYFGLLIAFAMFTALMANLILLPLLITLFKPFGKEKESL